MRRPEPTWALVGDIEKSRREYQNFLVIWKDADADIPTVQAAKGEYGDDLKDGHLPPDWPRYGY